MSRVAWNVRQWAGRVGRLGLTGIALLAFSLAFLGSGVYQRHVELARLQQEAASAQARHRAPAERVGTAAPERELRTFYAFFPPLNALPDALQRIYAAGRGAGIDLELGEYRLTQRDGHRLARYQMTLPMKGTYAQIRTFVGKVLEEVPALALDDIDLKRDAVSSSALRARIRMSLFFETGEL